MVDTEMFPHTCTTQRRTSATTDEVGRPVQGTYSTNLNDEPCHFQDRGRDLRAGRIEIEHETPRIFFEHDADVEIDDQIIEIELDGDETFSGPYRVTSKTFWPESHLECVMERIT